MSYNSQVCYLRKALNDKFDNTQRRITITNPINREYLTLYRRGEQRPVMLGQVFVNRRDAIIYKNEFTVIGTGGYLFEGTFVFPDGQEGVK